MAAKRAKDLFIVRVYVCEPAYVAGTLCCSSNQEMPYNGVKHIEWSGSYLQESSV